MKKEKEELESELADTKADKEHIKKRISSLHRRNKSYEETINLLGYEIEECHWGGFTLKKNKKEKE